VSCSAHPGLTAMIFISVEGENDVARHLPDSPSITEAFTEELPRSIPSNSILFDKLKLFLFWLGPAFCNTVYFFNFNYTVD
jgi:hypothetical protein